MSFPIKWEKNEAKKAIFDATSPLCMSFSSDTFKWVLGPREIGGIVEDVQRAKEQQVWMIFSMGKPGNHML